MTKKKSNSEHATPPDTGSNTKQTLTNLYNKVFAADPEKAKSKTSETLKTAGSRTRTLWTGKGQFGRFGGRGSGG